MLSGEPLPIDEYFDNPTVIAALQAMLDPDPVTRHLPETNLVGEISIRFDLAFAPAQDFGARAPTFRLVFGQAAELSHVTPPDAESLVGYGWLYALHVRSSLARGRLWQAEYMISAMRDEILALACLRHGLPVREGRGMDRLPVEITRPLEESLVRRIDPGEIARAFHVATMELLEETRRIDGGLASRLEEAVLALSDSSR